MVYHTTNAEFDEFKKKGDIGYNKNENRKTVTDNGIYFSEKSDDSYGKISMPTFLNINKPLNTSEPSDVISDKSLKEISDSKKDGVIEHPTLTDNQLKYFSEKYGQSEVKLYLAKKFVVFSPNQIKSATENVGTFSEDNNNINFSIGSIADGVSNDSEIIQKNKNNPLAKTWMYKVRNFYNQLLKSAKNILGFNPTKQVEKGIKAILNGETLAEMDGSQMSHLRTNFSIENNNKLGNGSSNSVYSQNIINYAREITKGTRILQRFSQEEQRGLHEGGTTHVEASLIVGRKVEAGETQDERNDRQESDIEQYAKEKGIWIEDTLSLADKYKRLNSGKESIVYDNGETVIKSKNTLQYRDLQDALDGITLHNTLFPSTNIKVIGFGKNADGDFQLILEQPYIHDSGTKATKQQIAELAQKLGFVHNRQRSDNDYINGQTIMNDLHDENVIIDTFGNLQVIDPIMHLNISDWGFRGERVVGDDNTDFSANNNNINFSIGSIADGGQ